MGVAFEDLTKEEREARVLSFIKHAGHEVAFPEILVEVELTISLNLTGSDFKSEWLKQ